MVCLFFSPFSLFFIVDYPPLLPEITVITFSSKTPGVRRCSSRHRSHTSPQQRCSFYILTYRWLFVHVNTSRFLGGRGRRNQLRQTGDDKVTTRRLIKPRRRTCNTSLINWWHWRSRTPLSGAFIYLPPSHLLFPFSRQLNSLHKCFVGGTSGCCCQGALDLISVMHREKNFKEGKGGDNHNHNNNNMPRGSHGASQ